MSIRRIILLLAGGTLFAIGSSLAQSDILMNNEEQGIRDNAQLDIFSEPTGEIISPDN